MPVAGVAGLVFVAVVVAGNVLLMIAGFPAPTGGPLPAAYATSAPALRAASALLPFAWVASVVFAAGVFTAARGGRWALVGAAGVVAQSVTFAVVEALRLGVAAAPGSAAGLWAACVALFAFNQVWLAVALLGFGLSGVSPRWLVVVALIGAALLFASAVLGTLGVETIVGLVGWLLWVLWVAATAVRLLRPGAPAH